MDALRVFVGRHPVLTYFVLTFAISWSGVLLVIGGATGLSGRTRQTIRASSTRWSRCSPSPVFPGSP